MTQSVSKPTPLHRIHVSLGASMTDFAGWAMPLRYGSEIAEHRAVRSAAGLFDLTHMGEIEVTGPAAGRALDHALVGDASAIAPGGARYAVLDAPGGAVVGTVTSGAPSPTLGHPIAMAYVDADRATPGTPLHIDVRGAAEPVEVVALPFYRRNR